eukprot:Gregarina_sp_Pseudo_9__5552@NODE_73_length_4587_cov_88_906113_g67_i0_p2_GENE_NODE_73_length_4587_cov_88_906113_g67_i0NODE_73_length_4587_cov_88_906113_g67_i0_p2_ORF_typecomplete_len372_score26_46PNK3P/PF08645_11/0_12CAML/PF14963_6/0_47_NODE_73_length_4587_cov_88_906113_g67_i02331348
MSAPKSAQPRAVESAPFGALPGDMTSSSSSCSSSSSDDELCVARDSPSMTSARSHVPYTNRQSSQRRSSVPHSKTSKRSAKASRKHSNDNDPIVYRKSIHAASNTLSRNSTDMSESTQATVHDSCPNESFNPEGTILIFDWDDTLCPSTWLSSHDMTLDDSSTIPPEFESLLNKMALCSQKTLEVAARLGTVVIVTNAEQGWIEMSCRKFLPSLYSYLSSFKQLSARSMYESASASCPFAWKQLAFKKEIYSHFTRTQVRKKNVISLGDSAHERLAIIAVTRSLASTQEGLPRVLGTLTDLPPDPEFVRTLGHCRTKSVKFIERPNIEELMQEHELICKVLEEVVQHDEDLDLCIKGTVPSNNDSFPASAM